MLKRSLHDSLGSWTPLLLRLVIGYGFMVHGMAKLNRGPDKFAAVLDWMQVPFPDVMAWLVTSLEVLGGVAILIGAWVSWVSLPLLAIHLVAMAGVHWQHGFSAVNTVGLSDSGPLFGPPGVEVNLLYIAGLLSLALGSGAGPWSVDSLRERHRAPGNAGISQLPDVGTAAASFDPET